MTTQNTRAATPIPRQPLVLALLLNLLWINASEVARYFGLVMPMMREGLPGIPDAAPMSLPIFLIWGVWDTILVVGTTGFAWLYMDRFGTGVKQALAAGTWFWLLVFGLLWLGSWNMNTAPTQVVLVALPLAWLEQIVAALIVRWCLLRPARSS